MDSLRSRQGCKQKKTAYLIRTIPSRHGGAGGHEASQTASNAAKNSDRTTYKEIKPWTDRSHITLYSGGHRGAEAEFGSHAEHWGIQEVNFSFEGHTVSGPAGSGC